MGAAELCDLFNNNAGQQAALSQQQMIQAQQAQHDAAVKQDIGSVDSAFAPFNNDYFSGFTKTYEDALNPQLDKQYGAANSQLTSNLAATDRDQGSTGAAANANLYNTYGNAREGIANSALDATNSLKGTVNNAKNSLYGLANQATDPLSLATQAQASAGSIVAPQSYPGIGNVFGDVLSPLAGGLRTSSQSTGNNNAGSVASSLSNFFAPVGGNSRMS
jgi:hypothetical protein